jgi:aryl sulfotransferase
VNTIAERPSVRHIYQNHHLDTRRWDQFRPRAGDIVVSTSYKAGTTLTQTIVFNLLFPNGDLPTPVMDSSPWLDMRVIPFDKVMAKLEAQTHRRCIKTHLPLDGLPYFDDVQYIAIGRDPRDVFMSLVNHYGEHTPQFFELINDTPGRVGDPLPPYDGDIHKLWRNWITRGWFDWESDGWPYWSHLHHAKTWWEFRHLPNIRLIHYNDLLRDLEGEMRALADYLEIAVPEERWPAVVDACRFETVKARPERVMSEGANMFWKEGTRTFFHKGTNGRWKDILSADELRLYNEAMRKTLPPDCAHWLEHGGRAA